MWNLIIDEAIEDISETGNEAIAYADDIAIVITGNSKKEIEQEANKVTEILIQWCQKQKLQLSSNKSHMILLKGILDIRRPPIVPVGNKSLRMVAETKYLGMYIGTRLNITPHINYISSKGKEIFNKLASTAKATWGLNSKTMRTLYRGIFVPIITYAAAGWADKLNVHHKRKLRQAQRSALLRVTKAYRTISTETLCVIAGAVPIELAAKEKSSLYYLRKGSELQHFSIHHEPQQQQTKLELERYKHTIRNETTRKWQEEWDASQKGRITHRFHSNIQDRLNAKWIHHNHYTVQMLSGHGNFKSNLRKLGLTDTGSCTCGKSDTVEHVIFECTLLTEIRNELQETARKKNIEWPYGNSYQKKCIIVSTNSQQKPCKQGNTDNKCNSYKRKKIVSQQAAAEA